MSLIAFPVFTKDQSKKLDSSLHFLHMEELKDLALRLGLSTKGKKKDLITRMMHYLNTGKKLVLVPYPKVSYAQKGVEYSISKSSFMLKGAYKNDLKTRLFFKKIIGDYFHFTAFGVDWLNECWMNGKPPTYQEFADMWKKEYQRRKTNFVPPKAEWAYITFVQQFMEKFPDVGREKVMNAWDDTRHKHKAFVMDFFDNLMGK